MTVRELIARLTELDMDDALVEAMLVDSSSDMFWVTGVEMLKFTDIEGMTKVAALTIEER